MTVLVKSQKHFLASSAQSRDISLGANVILSRVSKRVSGGPIQNTPIEKFSRSSQTNFNNFYYKII
jgi:hypothetical protein